MAQRVRIQRFCLPVVTISDDHLPIVKQPNQLWQRIASDYTFEARERAEVSAGGGGELELTLEDHLR